MASMTEPAAPLDAVNPMGTDGFEFVEYAAPDPAALDDAATRIRDALRAAGAVGVSD